MQLLSDVKLPLYVAAGNPFDVVDRPDVCGRCEGCGCFHRHGTYQRYMGNVLRKVARFVCALCGLTVSVLPAFVLPYRPRLIEEVDRYFGATAEERPHLSYADTLRRYWREWCAHGPVLQRQTGWPTVPRPAGESGLAREPRRYWQQLRAAAGNMAAAQRHLIGNFGLSLLRRYGCHRAATRA